MHHNGPMTFTNGEVSFWYRDIGAAHEAAALPGRPRGGRGARGRRPHLACGRRTTSSVTSRTCGSRCWRRSSPASAPPAATAAGSPPSCPGRPAATPPRTAGARPSRMQRQMFAAVDEVIDVAAKEGIEADIVKDGVLHVATNPAQERRAAGRRRELRARGLGQRRTSACWTRRPGPGRIAGVPASPCGARTRTHPPGPAGAGAGRRRRGHGRRHLRGHRGDPGGAAPGRDPARHGARASYVLRALEGFTADLAGHRRDWLPMNSSMVATAPLPDAVWEEIGWARRRGAR